MDKTQSNIGSKERKLTIAKNVFALIILMSFGLVFSLLGLKMFIEERTRNLETSGRVTGTIDNTRVVSKVKKVGAVPFVMKESNHLQIKLNDSDEKFATYNPEQEYSELRKELGPGQKVTIYFTNSSAESPSNNILQIEKNNQILLSHSIYSRNHSIAAIPIIIFGVFCLGCFFWSLRRKKLDQKWK